MGFGVSDNQNPFDSWNPLASNDPLKKKDGVLGAQGSAVAGPDKAASADAASTTAGSVFAAPAPGAVAPVKPMEAITDATKNGGADFVKDAKAAQGNQLGWTQGKAPDKDQKPAINASVSDFGPDGKPKTTTVNGIERAFGDKATVVEKRNDDGSVDRRSTVMGKDGKPISITSQRENADGSSVMKSHTNNNDGSTTDVQAKTDPNGQLRAQNTHTQTKDGTTIDSSVSYDKAGGLLKESSEMKSKDGKLLSASSKTAIGEGKFEVKTTGADGKTAVEQRDKNDRVIARQNPETGKMEEVKDSHKAGSLGDIRQQKADMEAQQKAKVEAELKSGKGKSGEKFQEFEKKSQALDTQIAKLDPVKDKAKIDKLQKKKDNIKEVQGNMVQSLTDKKLSKDEKYQDLGKKEESEQAVVDKYKDFNLTDKDGKKLSAEDISDRKDELFKDGKILDRDALAEKGVDMKYTQKAIMNDPMKVFLDDKASKGEKDKAMIALMLGGGAMGGGGAAPQGPQQSKGLQIANAAGSAFAQFAVAMSGGGAPQGAAPVQQNMSNWQPPNRVSFFK